VNPNHVEINAEAAAADPDSVFHHYRRLIELRHSLPVVVHGDYRLLLPEHEQVFAYVRTLGDEHLLVAVNCSGEPAPLDLGPDAPLLDGEVHLGSLPADALPPWHHLVVASS
jgi:oligo-1,6-glucosidase